MKLSKNDLSSSLFVLAALAISALPIFSAVVPAGDVGFTTLYSFTNEAVPAAALVQGTNGNLYGTTFGSGTNSLGTIFTITTNGDFTNLFVFDGTNGANPAGPLLLSSDHLFYGTTSTRGTNKGTASNQGTIFSITHAGAFKTLVRFSGSDGSTPLGGLVLGPHGYFYGTTMLGGSNSDGEVFAYSPGIGLSNIYSFSGTDGKYPYGGLVSNANGNLYGTTYYGGANGLGTVFTISPSNTFTTLFSFAGTNGSFPFGLAQAPNGLMFGATQDGGTNDFGSVFEITTSGGFTSLASFGITGAENPRATVLVGANGQLYGTTFDGGSGFDYGTVFQLSTNATTGSSSSFGGRGGRGGGFGGGGSSSGTSSAVLTNLVIFASNNGAYPQAGLMQANDGNLYGTTTSGGANGFGTIFQLSKFPPVIFLEPTNRIYATKGTATFTVGVTGSTPLAYQWSRNGVLLTNGFSVAGVSSNRLTIGPESLLTNAGSYTVVVSNAYGFATSAVATLALPTPTITIKAPVNSSSAVLTITGTAADPDGLSTVQWQVNNGAWNEASSANNWKNWSAKVTLAGGSNTFRAYSADLLGNPSATNSANVFFITASPLTLLTNGVGMIKPGFKGTNLVVDRVYALLAEPGKNFVFSNWSGDLAVTNNPLFFVMQSNLTLTANFVTNPFLPSVGTYDGLFYVPGEIGVETSGLLANLHVGTLGAYSAKLLLAGSNYTVTGGFDLAGNATNVINRTAALGPLTLAMHLEGTNMPPQVTGTVQGTNGGAWTAALTCQLVGGGATSAEYTMLIPPGADAPTNSPPGDGYAIMTNHLGTLAIAGALADGTAFSQTIAESASHQLAFYATPYTNGGLMLGWLDLSSGSPTGNLTLIRPPATKGFYTNGYTNVAAVEGSRWVDYAHATNILLLIEQLNISDAFLTAPLDFKVAVDYKNSTLAVQGGGPTNSLTGLFNPKNGLLSLTFGNGNGKKTTSATGVILQIHELGGGFFTTSTNAGAFTIHP